MSLFIIYFLHWAYQTKNNETGLFYGKSVFNILIYISCVLFVFALYIILKIVLNYISCKNKVLFVLYSGFFVYSIHFLYRMYEKEIEVVAGYELYINSMRQNMPFLLFLCLS